MLISGCGALARAVLFVFFVMGTCASGSAAAAATQLESAVQALRNPQKLPPSERLLLIRSIEKHADLEDEALRIALVMNSLAETAKRTVLGKEEDVQVNIAANKAIQMLKARARGLVRNPNPKVRFNALIALSADNEIQPLASTTMNLSPPDRELLLSFASDPAVNVRRHAVNLLWSLFHHDQALGRDGFSNSIIQAMSHLKSADPDEEIRQIANDFLDENQAALSCGAVFK